MKIGGQGRKRRGGLNGGERRVVEAGVAGARLDGEVRERAVGQDREADRPFGVIAGGAVGVWLLKKVLDFGEGAAKVVLELVFLGAVATYIGCTLPRKSGKPPLSKLVALFSKR